MNQKSVKFPIKTLKLSNPGYPRLLRKISHPPKLLYYRGTLPENLFNIAIVGSRKMSFYGSQAVASLIRGFAGLPICIVSGLAFGIDAAAHKSALNFKLPTIAVLGSGIDDQSIYPRANKKLADEILANSGCLLAVYPPGTKALSWHFPERNQIISGLSKAVIVVEAALKSGALITAEFGLEQNRDVFAIPGSIFQAGSHGPNNLIKMQRAKLISEAADIINEYPALQKLANSKPRSTIFDPDLSALQQKILNLIGLEPTGFADIYKASGLTAGELGSELILLEIKNKIRSLGNNCYARNLTK